MIYTLVVFILFEVTTKKRCYGMRHIASLSYFTMFLVSISLLDSLQNSFQSADEVIHILLGKAERWKQT